MDKKLDKILEVVESNREAIELNQKIIEDLAAMTQKQFEQVDARFEQVDQKFEGVNRRLDDLADTRVRTSVAEKIHTRLDQLEEEIFAK